MGQNLVRLFVDPFLGAYDRFAGAIPTLAAALLLLLVGMFLARAARSLIEVALGKLRLDDHTSRIGINEVISRLGLGKSPTFVLAWVAQLDGDYLVTLREPAEGRLPVAAADEVRDDEDEGAPLDRAAGAFEHTGEVCDAMA